MVDFDNEVTITTPASDVVRILILEARYNLFDAVENYLKVQTDGADVSTSTMKSRLWRLFMETEALLSRHMGEEDFKVLVAFCNDPDTSNPKEIMRLTGLVNATLDKLELIKIDNKRQLGGNIKDRNKAQGWSN